MKKKKQTKIDKVYDENKNLVKSNKRLKTTGIVLGSLLAASILTAAIATPIIIAKNKPAVVKTYKVEFEANGGTKVDMQTVEVGKKAIQPNSQQTDKWLEGWYEDSTLQGEKFDFTKGIEKDTKLYAKWVDDIKPVVEFNVKFHSNYIKPGETKEEVITTKIRQHHTTLPASMSREGYSLEGWYQEQTCTNKFEFNTTKIEKDTDIWAKWTVSQFKVSFDSNGGTNVEPINATYNQAILEPTAPTKTGNDFGGWYTDIALENQYNFETPVKSSFTLYAKWTPKSYTVTFDTDGAKETIDSQSVKFNEKASNPGTITKEGNTFMGWYSDSEKTKLFSFDTPITDNITIYAKWEVNKYTITYDTKGGTAVAPSTVVHGNTITKPTTTKTGYTCSKWYTNSGLTDEYDFTKPVTSSFTLYAKWDADQLTVKFVTNGADQTIADQTVSYDSTATDPGTITKTGHKFMGWYSDEGFTKPFSFSTLITSNMTLYAKWEINVYTVSFESNGGTHIADVSVNHGSTVAAPTAPTKVGSKFLYWCSDAELKTQYSFATAVTSSITLYAKWEETPVTKIVISGATDKQEVDTGTAAPNDITLSATVTPTTAVQTLKWTYETTDEKITFNTETHTISAPINTSGVINVTASATDGSAISSTIQIRYYDSSIFAFNATTSGDSYEVYAPLSSTINHKSLVLPSTYNGKNVTGLYLKSYQSGTPPVTKYEGAFENQTNVEEVYFPETITSISQYAFKKDTNLKKIVLPDSVTTISDGSFRSCSNLTSVHFGKNFTTFKKTTSETGVTDSHKTAFEGCPKITSFTVDSNNTTYTSVDGVLMTKDKSEIIKYPAGVTGGYTAPSTVTTIHDWAFYESTVNTNLELDNVTTLGQGSFSKAKLLTSWTIPSNVITIPTECFSYSGLININFANVENIEAASFFNCKLEVIAFSSAVKTINDFAFRANPTLKSVKFGSGTTSIGRGAFAYSPVLETIDFSEATELTTIGENSFEQCVNIKTVDLSNTKVSTIDAASFYGCTSINSVTFPDTLTAIKNNAFEGCTSLSGKSITIPSNVKLIGTRAFFGTGIASITFSAGVQTWTLYLVTIDSTGAIVKTLKGTQATSTDATTNASYFVTNTKVGGADYGYKLQWEIV